MDLVVFGIEVGEEVFGWGRLGRVMIVWRFFLFFE